MNIFDGRLQRFIVCVHILTLLIVKPIDGKWDIKLNLTTKKGRLIVFSLNHYIIIILLNMFIIGTAYTNPVIDYNTPDPGVLALPDGSGYVLVSTSNYAERGTGNVNAFFVSSLILF